MTDQNVLPETVQSFESIITRNGIYVDKTEYLVKMLESFPMTWFLARPRRFGKSLTVSTLESVLSDRKSSMYLLNQESLSSNKNTDKLDERQKLFDGLAIQNKLKEEPFAPRPVIKLDMSRLMAAKGRDEFELNLRKFTVDYAEIHGIKLSLDFSSSILFSELIVQCSIKNKSRVAVLIDEYDSPITKRLENPAEMDDVRETLQDYYMQLKSCSDYTSFVFVTGITKFVQGGIFSAFNNPRDITLDSDYGAITGFTHEEIIKYFPSQIRETAEYLDITEEELLQKLKSYYEGFCFDGKTYVYNPVSLFLFFKDKIFSNYFFSTGVSDQIIPYLKKHKFRLDSFSNVSVLDKEIETPSLNRDECPPSYFFQLGFLSLRNETSNKVLILDYPNLEVKQTMSRLIATNFFESPLVANEVFIRFQTAMIDRDPASLINELNIFLANIPYSDYTKTSHDERYYRVILIPFFHAMDAIIHTESQKSSGRPDIILHFEGQTWVLELKINHSNDKDETYTATAKAQMLELNYGEAFHDPVLLAITINDTKRQILSWWSQGGLSEGPKPESEEEPTVED